MNCDDVAQNRGGSRSFAETQQLLGFTYGPEMGSTLNTYAVMKSGMKNVDSTGRSGPIPSEKAQKRLDDYKAGAGDDNTKELDGKVLYSIGGGMPHGRVPIANGAVKKAHILAAAKSMNVKPTNSDSYRRVVQENDQLKEANKKLKETNELLIEENGVNRDLIMRFYADFGKEPPADLLKRIANIDARRHQVAGSPNAASDLDDDMGDNENTDDDSDDDFSGRGDNNFNDRGVNNDSSNRDNEDGFSDSSDRDSVDDFSDYDGGCHAIEELD